MKKHLHLLGICGTFMGGIAVIARQLGFKVTGSDENIYPPMSDNLNLQGIAVFQGYNPKHLQPNPDCVIIGNVCSRGNPAVEFVMNENIPYISAPEWLFQQVLCKRHVLAVAGTHGKTTTTSLLTWILQQTGRKPGYLIGGTANNFSATAELGQSEFFVIEADEYDSAFFDKRPKFLHYRPSTLIINNIEFDHADIYSDIEAIQQQFQYLLRSVPGSGLILLPECDSNIQSLFKFGRWSRTAFFSGNSASLQYRLLNNDASAFEILSEGKIKGSVHWNQFGEHNVQNAMAALSAAINVGVELNQAIKALSTFLGVKKRLELVGQMNEITIYNDFAHHPTAIKASLQALRAKVGKNRIIAVIQLASNTMRLGRCDYLALAKALQQADQTLVLQPRSKLFNTDKLLANSNNTLQLCVTTDEIVRRLEQTLSPGDSVLIMSNAEFEGLQEKLFARLSLTT